MNKTNTKRRSKEDKKRFWVRVMCIVLCVLLVGGTLTSVLYSLLWK